VRRTRFNPEVLRLWIAFEPGRAPRVGAAYWIGGSDLQEVWSGLGLVGRSWANNDGSDVGAVDGPDVIVEVDFTARVSGSPAHIAQGLLLPAESLVRSR
ncbi:MAG TPA: hypothetical protein VMT18_14855, partial [Planctomycetota bacterium]|nr:hypothetical protein [Planctomycetota bacterium]